MPFRTAAVDRRSVYVPFTETSACLDTDETINLLATGSGETLLADTSQIQWISADAPVLKAHPTSKPHIEGFNVVCTDATLRASALSSFFDIRASKPQRYFLKTTQQTTVLVLRRFFNLFFTHDSAIRITSVVVSAHAVGVCEKTAVPRNTTMENVFAEALENNDLTMWRDFLDGMPTDRRAGVLRHGITRVEHTVFITSILASLFMPEVAADASDESSDESSESSDDSSYSASTSSSLTLFLPVIYESLNEAVRSVVWRSQSLQAMWSTYRRALVSSVAIVEMTAPKRGHLTIVQSRNIKKNTSSALEFTDDFKIGEICAMLQITTSPHTPIHILFLERVGPQFLKVRYAKGEHTSCLLTLQNLHTANPDHYGFTGVSNLQISKKTDLTEKLATTFTYHFVCAEENPIFRTISLRSKPANSGWFSGCSVGRFQQLKNTLRVAHFKKRKREVQAPTERKASASLLWA